MQLGDVIDGKYELLRLMGTGGMGSVFEARHKLIGRRYAVKCLHPQLVSDESMVTRFVQEAQAATAIGNEHIVDVTDAGILADGAPYLVMEHLEGEDLGGLLEREGAQPQGRAVALIGQVCEALAAAHARDIVHRDLKPENLFSTRKADGAEWIKVLDFGIAKVRAGPSQALTQTGTTMGTGYYMAPEQFRGAKDVDGRADIYSTGVILYELLTGARPFSGNTYEDLIIQVATATPPSPRSLRADIDPLLEAKVLKAMARAPEARHESMAALAADLGHPVKAAAIPATAAPHSIPATAPPQAIAQAGSDPYAATAAPGSHPPVPATQSPQGEPLLPQQPLAATAPNLAPLSPVETQPVAKGRTLPIVVAALVVLLLSGAVVGFFFAIREPESEPTTTQAAVVEPVTPAAVVEPVTPAAPTPTTVEVFFTTDMPGTRLLVDGYDYGEIGAQGRALSLRPGNYTIQGRYSSDISVTQTLRLESGQSRREVTLAIAAFVASRAQPAEAGAEPAEVQATPPQETAPREPTARNVPPTTTSRPAPTQPGGQSSESEAIATARRAIVSGNQQGCIEALRPHSRSRRAARLLVSCYQRSGNTTAGCRVARRHPTDSQLRGHLNRHCGGSSSSSSNRRASPIGDNPF